MIRKIILVLLIVCITFCPAIGFSAMGSDSHISGLYIETDTCSDDCIKYAQDNIARFIMGSDDGIIEHIELVKLGTPFRIYGDIDLYCFPVLYNDEMIYLFQIYQKPEGGFTGTLSPFLAAELRGIMAETSVDHPAVIAFRNGNVVAAIGSNEKVLFENPYPEQENSKTENGVDEVEKNTVNILEAAEPEKVAIQRAKAVGYEQGQSNYLTIDIIELQKDADWCVAYSAAAIIRYLGFSNVTASEITYYLDPLYSKDSAVSYTDIQYYVEQYGFTPVYITQTLTPEEFAKQIDNDKPVEMSMGSLAGGSGHAIVGRGYNLSTETYSIWNPWYDYYETISFDGYYLIYQWRAALYNW